MIFQVNSMSFFSQFFGRFMIEESIIVSFGDILLKSQYCIKASSSSHFSKFGLLILGGRVGGLSQVRI